MRYSAKRLYNRKCVKNHSNTLRVFHYILLMYIQYRKGPNKLLFKGLFQPFTDMLKLIFKEIFYLRLNILFEIYIFCIINIIKRIIRLISQIISFELNRIPFDLIESTELLSGFNLEY
ncbi:hypothetical protein E2986_13796 [Frieseomelitta varia]|uniref:NADH-ubiquinone oxidoreductase chain 1 n=1 Tax=Frieseomelitta varia TaxID=561572 RepID=A0A833RZL2_9HYME|nr:hypothetical protein E2986_13796 [Frieseomelitta varia]